MTAGTPDVLADPVGVIVAVVGGVEPALERAVIEDVVISVAGGRAKRRKLAQSLARRPAILTDGRSPAPRAAGDLLVALRKAGARTVSPPVCAGCGKQLPAPRRGLVLLRLRAKARAVRGLRQGPGHPSARPGRRVPVR
ncbi:MAG: hypothetical protein M3Z75_29055 [Actinomycetota bacterium]|nr:hypothetical protein [Actinomycetota bacterium]